MIQCPQVVSTPGIKKTTITITNMVCFVHYVMGDVTLSDVDGSDIEIEEEDSMLGDSAMKDNSSLDYKIVSKELAQ